MDSPSPEVPTTSDIADRKTEKARLLAQLVQMERMEQQEQEIEEQRQREAEVAAARKEEQARAEAERKAARKAEKRALKAKRKAEEREAIEMADDDEVAELVMLKPNKKAKTVTTPAKAESEMTHAVEPCKRYAKC